MQRRYVLLADDSFINYFSNVIRGSVWILLSLVAVIWPITVYSTWRRSVFHYLMKSRCVGNFILYLMQSLAVCEMFPEMLVLRNPLLFEMWVRSFRKRFHLSIYLFIIKHIHVQYMNLDNAAKRKKQYTWLNSDQNYSLHGSEWVFMLPQTPTITVASHS